MKNVLFVFSTLKKSGPINIIINLLHEIDREKFNPIVLSLSDDDDNEISAIEDLQNLNISYHTLGLSRFNSFFVGKKEILNFCKSNKINSIHLIGFRADILVRGKEFRDFKLISSVFSNLFEDYSMLYGKIKGKIMANRHLSCLKGKAKVACSYSVHSALMKYLDGDFVVIQNSVSKSKFFVPNENDKRIAKKKLGIDLNIKVFIFVGVLISRKDPLTTIQAFLNSSLNKRGEAVLIIIGDGALRSNLESLCIKSNSVFFMGNTSETIPYLHASDYYIASSLSEGLPTSVIEALSCGLVPILSDIVPHNEVLQEYKSQKFIFAPTDISQLTNIIDSVENYNYNELSCQSRFVVENYLNSEIMTKKYQALY